MIAIEGSTITLTCPLQGSSFIRFKLTTSDVSMLQQGAKQGDANIGYLAIYNVDPHDGGKYLYRTGLQQILMNIFFRGT